MIRSQKNKERKKGGITFEEMLHQRKIEIAKEAHRKMLYVFTQ